MPIVGHGDIASVLTDRDDITYFASGVSNSREIRELEYEREANLLLSQDREKRLVYFSSLSIFYSQTPYALHKRYMESLVRGNFDKWNIMRMGNITWGNNPHTLINFIRSQIRNREVVNVQDVYRYILDKDEFLYWMNMIPDWNCEMNIIGRRMKVLDIVKQYCYPWGKTAEDAQYEAEAYATMMSRM